jgi:hypothetical protein
MKDATPDMSATGWRTLVLSRKTTFPVGGSPVAVTVALITTACPRLAGLGLEVTTIVLANFATFCVTAGEPLLAKLESPLYVAVIGLLPGGSDDVL